MKKGFTIVEVLVALAIAAVAAGIFFEIITTTLNGISLSQIRAGKIYSAQQIIEASSVDLPLTMPSTPASLSFYFKTLATTVTVNGTIVTDPSDIFHNFVPFGE